MSADEDFVLMKLAEVVNDMAEFSGMSFDEIWDCQFEGRSITVVERTREDGLTEMVVEFGEADPDGGVVWSYRREPSGIDTSDQGQVT